MKAASLFCLAYGLSLSLVACSDIQPAALGGQAPEITVDQQPQIIGAKDSQFLGDQELNISEQVYNPHENKVEIGTPSANVAYGNFHYLASEAQIISLASGTAMTAGCEVSDIKAQYTWIEMNAEGKEISRTPVEIRDSYQLKAGTPYILKAEYSNLSACQYVWLSFLAVRGH